MVLVLVLFGCASAVLVGMLVLGATTNLMNDSRSHECVTPVRRAVPARAQVVAPVRPLRVTAQRLDALTDRRAS